MPLYEYRNTETGEEWSEFRSMDKRLDGVDGEKIILKLSAPKQRDPDLNPKRLADFEQKVLNPAEKRGYFTKEEHGSYGNKF